MNGREAKITEIQMQMDRATRQQMRRLTGIKDLDVKVSFYGDIKTFDSIKELNERVTGVPSGHRENKSRA